MKERPIIFSGPMVRAILEGRKTQTRRLIKPQPDLPADFAGARADEAWAAGYVPVRCPYGKPGDRLWVREAWAAADDYDPDRDLNPGGIFFRATHSEGDLSVRWRSPIFMPRWASRLTLVVTDVRVQRLQEISDWHILAEGMPAVSLPAGSPLGRAWFREGWDQINGARAPWANNPWVWAVTFKREGVQS